MMSKNIVCPLGEKYHAVDCFDFVLHELMKCYTVRKEQFECYSHKRSVEGITLKCPEQNDQEKSPFPLQVVRSQHKQVFSSHPLPCPALFPP